MATELACEKIQDQAEKTVLRNKIASILRNAKSPPPNINRNETKAICTLKNDTESTILPADKGRTIVVLDTDHYEKQMTDMLQDKNTYEVQQKAPTEIKENKLKSALRPLLNENKINKQT